MSEIENLKIGNGGTLHIVGNEDIIANEWEAGQVYIESRSYVIREHKLLMCNTTHTSVEPFDPDKWTEKNIGEALGTAGSANMIECTLAEYNAWKAGGQLINETVYIITDAPNLNETAKDISYDGSTDTVWDKVEALKWVDATAEFTKESAFDTTQSSYILYNDALKMYAVSFAVKANSADNAVIFSSVPQLKNDVIVLPTGFANAGGLSVTQANVIYYKANNNIVLRISTTTNVPVFVTAFLLKA